MATQPLKPVDTVRCPRIEGLADDVIALLHQSNVRLVQMRRSLELTSMHIERSREAVRESRQLLSRVHKNGFF